MTNTTVVVLNYNGEKLLNQFLPSVVANSGDARIVVVDNGSTDNSVSLLQQEFSGVSVINLGRNYGFCGGYNRSLIEIDTKYAVLLNSDVEVTPGWLTPTIALLESNPEIAAVQPKILSYTNKDHFEYAGAGGGFIDWLGYPFCRGRLFDAVEKDEGQYDDTREVFWASGACLIIRLDIYKKLGGLDEDFFAHMEEIDLCWRIKRQGLQIYYCGESTVYHLGAGTLEKQNPRKTFYNFRNGLSLLIKHWSTAQLIVKFPLRILLDYTAALYFIFKGQGSHAWSIIRAHFSCIAMLVKNLSKRRKLKGTRWVGHIYHESIIWQYYLRGRRKVNIR